jgi:hypothetical protein
MACALAFGALMAPAMASARPPEMSAFVTKPSGDAIVRIDMGDASARAQSQGRYRIVVPQGANIRWMGEVQRKGTRIGSFSPRALVGGWARLGHSNDRQASATLTWREKGASTPTFRVATLESPRLTGDGRLAFTAKVEGALPRTMVGFTININRPGSAPRVPGGGASIAITQTVSVQAVLTSKKSGYVAWSSRPGNDSACADTLPFDGQGQHPLEVDILCGGLVISKTLEDGSPSYVELVDGQVNLVASYRFPSSGAQRTALVRTDDPTQHIDYFSNLIKDTEGIPTD